MGRSSLGVRSTQSKINSLFPIDLSTDGTEQGTVSANLFPVEIGTAKFTGNQNLFLLFVRIQTDFLHNVLHPIMNREKDQCGKLPKIFTSRPGNPLYIDQIYRINVETAIRAGRGNRNNSPCWQNGREKKIKEIEEMRTF